MILNLGIALPLNNDKEYSQFWDSFHLMHKPDHVYIRPEYPGPADVIRNELVKKAFETGCSHLIMMDTDQVYPIDLLDKMIPIFSNPDILVVSTIVHRRYDPFDPLVFQIVKDVTGELHIMRMTDEEIFTPPLIKVGATGFGCIMFDMRVFNEIPYPWFVDEAYARARGEANQGNFTARPPGEDIGFCYKLFGKGIGIYVDTTIKIDHLSLVAVNRELYKLYNIINKKTTTKGEVK